jgi:beta-galactosidase
MTSAEVAIVYDWENAWAIEGSSGPRLTGMDYLGTCRAHYAPFWQAGVPVDVVASEGDFGRYRLVVAPMLYLVKPGVAERLEAFVQGGGLLVTTYWTGIVDENDRCFGGGFPGPLRKVLGIWSEEIDALRPGVTNAVEGVAANPLGLTGPYEARELCDLIHAETADVLATYAADFYAGRPAVTRNRLGAGEAYYVASRNDDAFLRDFLGAAMRRAGIAPYAPGGLPEGVTVRRRVGEGGGTRFLMNCSGEIRRFTDPELGPTTLEPYEVRVVAEAKPSTPTALAAAGER